MMKIKIILIVLSLLQINITHQTTQKELSVNNLETMEIGETISIKQDGYIEVNQIENNLGLTNETMVTANAGTNMVNFNISTRSLSFESFNPDSYFKRTPTNQTQNVVSADFSIEENIDINTYVGEVDGHQVSFSDGYISDGNPVVNVPVEIPGGGGDPNDNRQLITNPKTDGYLRTGKTIAKYHNVYNNVDGYLYTILSYGTGFMEGPNLMVTAGHCVYGDPTVKDFDDGLNNPRFPDELEFYPGVNGDEEVLEEEDYEYYAEGFVINLNTDYYLNRNANSDWAAIELDRNIGERTGWYGKISNFYTEGSYIKSNGYPTDKDNTQWYSEGKILEKMNDYKIYTDVYGVGGQSGSAYHINYNSGSYVSGILTHNHTEDNWVTICGTSGVYFNDFIYHYLNSFVTNHNVVYEVATIQPSDYNFADAYPTDSNTGTNFITHNLGDISFRTRRYRTGYIQQEYIVMSCVKTDITYAWIEYEFDIPVYKIDVELTHWREYSNEWLDKDSGVSKLQLWHDDVWWNPFDEEGWVDYFDLLSDETALPRDRTNPTLYTIEFEEPVSGFRFYSSINSPRVSSNNRGRVCIGDMTIYTYAS